MATIEQCIEVEVQLLDERVAWRNADGKEKAGVVVRRED